MPRKLLIVIALAAISFIFYANALNGEFITDDIQTILRNPAISQIQRFWFDPAAFLNSFNYLLAANNPWGYHLTNIILHAINSALAFFFLAIFFSEEAAFLGACIFAVHPVNTEAVSWVSGRPYLISAFFMLAGFLLYVHKGNLARYLVCLLMSSYFMAAHTFSFYLLFPLVIIFFDFVFGKWKNNFLRWLPFICIPVFTYYASGQRLAVAERLSYMLDKMGYAFAPNPLTYFAYSFYTHLRLLLWPDKLTLYHEPVFIPNAMLDYRVLLYLLPVIFCLFFTWKKARALFFALGLFIISLAPTYSPLPLTSLIAERYLYFPCIALSIFSAFIYEKISLLPRWPKAFIQACWSC